MNENRLSSFIAEQKEKYIDKEILLFGEKIIISKIVFMTISTC